MFDSLKMMMPMLEKKLKLKQSTLATADEFKAALQQLSAGAGAAGVDRIMVTAEYEGRPVVAVLVRK